MAERIGAALGGLDMSLRRTVAFDRGFEFMGYPALDRSLGTTSCFCDPRSPWQKGAVENANGRLRRYLPSDASAERLSAGSLDALAERLNATPRRCLGYRTPAEVPDGHRATGPAEAGPAAAVSHQGWRVHASRVGSLPRLRLSIPVRAQHLRTPAAGPSVAGSPFELRVRARRFRCARTSCARRTFAEPLPGTAARRACQTRGLGDMQRHIGLAAGGEAGLRLAQRLAMPASPDTLLRAAVAIRAKHRPPGAANAGAAVMVGDDQAELSQRQAGNVGC